MAYNYNPQLAKFGMHREKRESPEAWCPCWKESEFMIPLCFTCRPMSHAAGSKLKMTEYRRINRFLTGVMKSQPFPRISAICTTFSNYWRWLWMETTADPLLSLFLGVHAEAGYPTLRQCQVGHAVNRLAFYKVSYNPPQAIGCPHLGGKLLFCSVFLEARW
jgi:hypothetical protein